MAKNKMTDVRDNMILAMEKLNGGDMTPEVGKAVAELGKVLVSSAKAEIDFIKVTGRDDMSTGFVNVESTLGNNMIGNKEIKG